MKLSQWMKLSGVCASLIVLAACSSFHKKQDTAAVDQANAAYTENGSDEGDSAQATGSDDSETFGEEGGKNQANAQEMNQSAGTVADRSKRVYHFDFNSDVVRDDDKPAILANAAFLSSHAKKHIILEGHTDPRGSREYNIGLGERRAKAVAQMLSENGVNPEQIRIVSYGSQKPAEPGHDEAAYQADRRAVIAYLQG